MRWWRVPGAPNTLRGSERRVEMATTKKLFLLHNFPESCPTEKLWAFMLIWGWDGGLQWSLNHSITSFGLRKQESLLPNPGNQCHGTERVKTSELKDENQLRVKNPALNWARRTDTYKGRYKGKRKHDFSQGHVAATKCFNNPLRDYCFLTNDTRKPIFL